MKKQKKLNLKKIKVANMNTLYSLRGGMSEGCNTNHTCPKTFLCVEESVGYTCTCDTTILTVPLTEASCTTVPSDDCGMSDTCGISGACGD